MRPAVIRQECPELRSNRQPMVVEAAGLICTGLVDEPTGETHLSLVIAGAHDIPFEDAENRKIDPLQQPVLFPVVKPVLEKVASIVARHIEGFQVPEIALVGGTSAFYRAAEVIQEYTGIPNLGSRPSCSGYADRNGDS